MNTQTKNHLLLSPSLKIKYRSTHNRLCFVETVSENCTLTQQIQDFLTEESPLKIFFESTNLKFTHRIRMLSTFYCIPRTETGDPNIYLLT